MIAVVLVLFAVALLASRVLSRLGDTAEDKNNTIASLARAQAALDQYVASGGASARLPCPADPNIDETQSPPDPFMGVEQRRGNKDCQFTAGTLPWLTIGLRRDDSYDAWGRKISYRVYISSSGGPNNTGSLVQERGPSMVDCFDDGIGPGTKLDSDGLCNTDHTTYKAEYVSKISGLALSDMGAARSDVAYVVISHGPSGLGGYSAAGVNVLTESHKGPAGHEKDNTKDAGPFHIDAWSDPDIAPTDSQHFDDLLAYRTLTDLIFKARLTPRNWPVAASAFDAATVGAAFGGGPASAGDTSAHSSVNFGSVIATASGGSGARISYDQSNGTGGIGVSSGGSGTALSSTFNEQIRFDLPLSSAQLAVTLNNFGSYTQTFPVVGTLTFVDQVQFTFYSNNAQVAQVQKPSCRFAPTLASFVLAPGVTFDRIDIKPLSATVSGVPLGDTSFYISSLSACRANVSCTTSLATPANTCT